MEWYLKAFKNYAKFDGRAHQAEYWYFVLFNLIVSFVLGFVDGLFGLMIAPGSGLISSLYSLVIIVPSLAVAIRRMHDVGKSGWFILIPFYNLYLAIIKGDEGTNAYGPNPLNPDTEISDHLIE